MNFKETTEYIFKHPFFKEAILKFKNGDPSDLKEIFTQTQIEVWETTCRNAAKEYGRNKWGQHQDIREKIRELPPPTTLDLYLPIPIQPELPFGKQNELFKNLKS